jgi:cytoskeletal protein RodZ
VDKIDTKTEVQEESQPTKPLGELLKGYRERADMDYAQAANTLCLTVATLEALENEQFDLLPEAPYIRGYLRSYAKLAHVSSAEAIARYEEIRGGTSTAANLQYNFSPTSSVNNIIKPAISPIMFRFGIIAVVILSLSVISMLPDVRAWSTGIWTEFSQKTVETEAQSNQQQASKPQSPEQNTNTASSETAVATTEIRKTVPVDPALLSQSVVGNMDGNINRQNQSEVDAQTETNDKNTSQVNHAVPEPKDSQTATTLTEAPPTLTPTKTTEQNANTATSATSATSSNEQVSTPDNASSATINPSEAVAQNATAASTSNTAANNVNEATTTTAENPTSETAATTAIEETGDATNATAEAETTDSAAQTGEVSIKLVFTKDVWMRVDSNKKKVFSGLKKNGDTEEFKATKPLSFKVGNAPGVEIYINGQRYDQTPHTRGAVSRFKIEDTP